MKKRARSSPEPAGAVEPAFREAAALIARVGADAAPAVRRMAVAVTACFRKGGKLLVCGNGGSAADAQHLSGELVGRFLRERAPLSCIALSVDTSVLTAVGNDYGFAHVFARQVAAHGRPGDVLLAISTSGSSPNVLRAAAEARRRGMRVLALSGKDGGALARAADICISVPGSSSPRIQEVHAVIGHVLCEMVEAALFGE